MDPNRIDLTNKEVMALFELALRRVDLTAPRPGESGRFRAPDDIEIGTSWAKPPNQVEVEFGRVLLWYARIRARLHPSRGGAVFHEKDADLWAIVRIDHREGLIILKDEDPGELGGP